MSALDFMSAIIIKLQHSTTLFPHMNIKKKKKKNPKLTDDRR